jgi:hypothetical protein
MKKGLPTLADGAPARTWQILIATLRADPVLSGVFPPTSWYVYDGVPTAGAHQSKGSGAPPTIRILPGFGQTEFWSTSNQVGALIGRVEIEIPGTCVTDAMNVWTALGNALFPADQRIANALAQKLREAGCMTGLVRLSIPAYDPGPDADGGGRIIAQGQFSIDVKNRL